MKEEEILDAPDHALKKTESKWKWAGVSITTLSVAFILLSLFIYNYNGLLESFAIILSLYLFIKKVKPDSFDALQLFWWSVLIVLFSYLVAFSFLVLLDQAPFHEFTLWLIFILLWKSIVLGYLPAIGIIQLIKNKNWALLILMIFISWISMTIFNF